MIVFNHLGAFLDVLRLHRGSIGLIGFQGVDVVADLIQKVFSLRDPSFVISASVSTCYRLFFINKVIPSALILTPCCSLCYALSLLLPTTLNKLLYNILWRNTRYF